MKLHLIGNIHIIQTSLEGILQISLYIYFQYIVMKTSYDSSKRISSLEIDK